jgi:hypothetical protein
MLAQPEPETTTISSMEIENSRNGMVWPRGPGTDTSTSEGQGLPTGIIDKLGAILESDSAVTLACCGVDAALFPQPVCTSAVGESGRGLFDSFPDV